MLKHFLISPINEFVLIVLRNHAMKFTE